MIRAKTPKKPVRRNGLKNSGDHVEVYCRIRPVDSGECLGARKLNATTVLLTPPEGMTPARNGQQLRETHHTFQHVFDESSTQLSVYQRIALPLVDDVLHGKNALLFAYGVTCSGKTHTMTGSPQDSGLLPRCLDCIFNSVTGLQTRKYVFKPDRMNGFEIQTDAEAMLERQAREILPKLTPAGKKNNNVAGSTTALNRIGSTSDDVVVGGQDDNSEDGDDKIDDVDVDNGYAVFISYVEIYNNYIYDLLDEPSSDPISGVKPPTSKLIREDGDRNMYVSGIVEVEVQNTTEACDLLARGKKRRKVANTALNSESSRSHSVFSIRVVQAPLDPTGAQIIQNKKHIRSSQLCLVDLAGSERAGRTATAGDRLKEASNINQSLMCLRSCIEMLRENQKTGANKMVPYRDSRLTHLFKNFFDGEGKVRMIICVNPKASEYEETVQVMKFAELTQEVQISRAQDIKVDLGLPQGRRLLHQKLIQDQAESPQDIEVNPAEDDDGLIGLAPRLVYNLGPNLPQFEDFNYNDEASYYYLCQFLLQREMCRTTILGDLTVKEEAFRSRLEDMDKENFELKKTNDQLQRKVAIYERERLELEREVGEKSWKCLQERLEKDRLRLDYNAKLAANEQKYNHNIEVVRRKVKEETAAQLRSKQQKLDTLRNIINSETDVNTSHTDSRFRRVGSGAVPSGGKLTPSGPLRSNLVPARSETDIANSGFVAEVEEGRIQTQRSGVQRAIAQANSRGLIRPTRARSPPPTKTKPIPAKKNHRRSRSNESIWIEHKATAIQDQKTLLQPQMKIGRSVARLTERDMKDDRATNYLLSHQDVDSEGDVITKFVKGDIKSTPGGGASVVFTDVEVVKRTGPPGSSTTGRKRLSSDLMMNERDEDNEKDWTDVETRCSIGIEGHPKRIKTTDI